MSELEALGFGPDFAAQTAGARLAIARVAAEHRSSYVVWTAAGEFQARLAGRFLRDDDSLPHPAVGDWVVLRSSPIAEDLAVIERVLERRTEFSRGAAGRQTKAQVVAANIDVVFIVSGLDQDHNPRRIERYLARIWASGAKPIVLLNKADLCPDVDERVAEIEAVAIGVDVVAISALEGDGVAVVREHLAPGRTAAFVGSSGAGKSTLINALVGENRMATNSIRESDGRGQHTTTHRQLILLPSGGLLIDTPGMRELQLADTEGLDNVFGDVEVLARSCRFNDCAHESEPGCAVLAAIEDGNLAPERFEHYRKLVAEARAFERRNDKRQQKEYVRATIRLHRGAMRMKRFRQGE